MGRFNSLYAVGEVLSKVLKHDHPELTVRIGAPPSQVDQQSPFVCLTLMFVTPNPFHRNDPPYRNAENRNEAALATITAFYAVTTYGTINHEAETAHNLLGTVIDAFHQRPEVDLPFDGKGTDGKLTMTVVPTDVELMEKVFAPLQIPHRPWLLLDAGPVQLQNLVEPGLAAKLVSPKGVQVDIRAHTIQPRITQISPSPASLDSRVRIDATYDRPVTAIRVGAINIPLNPPAVPGGPPIMVAMMPPPGPFRLDPGTHDISLVFADTHRSESVPLGLYPRTHPALIPPLDPTVRAGAQIEIQVHALPAGDYTIYMWPNGNLGHPGDIHKQQVTVASNKFRLAIPADCVPRAYRISLEYSQLQYTSHLALEVLA